MKKSRHYLTFENGFHNRNDFQIFILPRIALRVTVNKHYKKEQIEFHFSIYFLFWGFDYFRYFSTNG
jgi:hypothetical protein